MPDVYKLYRIMRWFYTHHLIFLSRVMQLVIFYGYNCAISGKVQIGKGALFVRKGVSVVLHDKAVIGDNCRLGIHLCVVGQNPYKEVPKIGNNVYFGPNVTVQGPVIIEDGAVIAPGTVVNKSVPKNAIVAGVPAKIIGYTDELGYDMLKNNSFKEGTRPYLQDMRKK